MRLLLQVWGGASDPGDDHVHIVTDAEPTLLSWRLFQLHYGCRVAKVTAALGARQFLLLLFPPLLSRPDGPDHIAVVLALLRHELEDVYDAGGAGQQGGALEALHVSVVPADMAALLQDFVSLHHHVNVPAEEEREPCQAHADPQLHKEAVGGAVLHPSVHT